MSPLLLDTSVAIELLNDAGPYLARIQHKGTIAVSVVTVIELEGGLRRDDVGARLREDRLRDFLEFAPVIAFDTPMAGAYGEIVAALGFSRRQVLDRMIAATALVLNATLATRNPADFQAVPGLNVEPW